LDHPTLSLPDLDTILPTYLVHPSQTIERRDFLEKGKKNQTALMVRAEWTFYSYYNVKGVQLLFTWFEIEYKQT
jgi:hypothetical protein